MEYCRVPNGIFKKVGPDIKLMFIAAVLLSLSWAACD